MTTMDDRIADLFLSGYGIDFVSERGVTGGWARGDALRVASQRGWQLDKSGRVAREERRAPRPPAAMRPGRILEERRAPQRVVAAPPVVPTVAVVTEPAPVVLSAVPDDEIVEVTAETLYEPEPAAALPAAEQIGRAINATTAEVDALQRLAEDLGADLPPEQPVDVLAAGLDHPSPRVRKLARDAQAAVDNLVTALLRRPV